LACAERPRDTAALPGRRARCGSHRHQFEGFRRQFVCLRRPFMTARLDEPVARRAASPDELHAGRQGRRRAPWLWRVRPRLVTRSAGRANRGTARARTRPCATATERGGRHRARARAGTAARARSGRLSLLGRTGPGRRAPGGGCPAGRDAGAPAAVAARLGVRGALACVARDGQGGRAPRSPAVFPEGGRAGLWLVAVCGPRARSARGRRARHAECRTASVKGRRWWHSACRVPRLFAPGPREVAR
jgi:hypothetical protein